MRVHRLSIDDYETVVELWSRADLPFRPKGRDSKEAIVSQMAGYATFFLGAYENDHLVGVAILTYDGRKGWINRLAVDPDHRHQGVAQMLISESEQEFKKLGIALFCCLIDDDNVASKSLFRKCGYVEHADITYFSKRVSDDV